ncbi:hypothetical protein OSB04_001607 [Centaurea solstitialis]|uniref:SWIM-type domain-containing protein n=1 Tax=Centaurea solstitialis TaxID=347529 RepID=A0AA38WV02_9ASTR|nr:hypothetical protein OSB04_001607 [Centaurea solstitialis]
MEEEENVCTSDDNSDGGLDMNKEWVNYTFSDVDDDDIASVNHLSEEDEEIREVRLRRVNKEGKTVNVQNVELINVQQVRLGKELANNENVMVDDDGTLLSEDVVEAQSYEHDEFLTEICDGYERDMFVEEEVDSDNESVMADEDEKDNTNKFPIHNPHILWNLMKPQVCERYALAAELKTCLTNYAIANGLQLRYLKNTKKKLLVVCGPSKPGEERSCPWRLWASWMSTKKSFQVKTLHDEHRCGRNYRVGSLVNSNWIAKQYGRKIRQNPSMKLVDLQESILKKYKCIVTIGQCSRAKAKALGEVEIVLVEHYGKLWDYGEEIMRSNPGSTVKMSVEVGPDQKNYFQRFYVCLKGVKEGWLSGCRKFIGLDGCFLKTICKGELLSVVGRDANNQIYPLAWAVVEIESKNSWKWFLEYLMEDIGLTAGLGVTIMSDQHKGLVEAVKDVDAPSIDNMLGTYMQISGKKYIRIQFRTLFWAASKAGTPEEFQCVMQEIKDLSHQAFNHLMERRPNTWSRAFFKTETSCDAVENGVSDCFNSLIVSSRRKPIITMLEEIRVFIMERIENMNKQSCKWNDEICSVLAFGNGGDQFEVRQGLEGYVVDTRERTCTCKIWQLFGICPHAVASIYFIHMEPEVFVSDFFSRSYFIATYNHKVNPLNGLKLWPKTSYLKPLPPRIRRMPGRPSVSRKKDASESSYRIWE